jgi:hypothetical protein
LASAFVLLEPTVLPSDFLIIFHGLAPFPFLIEYGMLPPIFQSWNQSTVSPAPIFGAENSYAVFRRPSLDGAAIPDADRHMCTIGAMSGSGITIKPKEKRPQDTNRLRRRDSQEMSIAVLILYP